VWSENDLGINLWRRNTDHWILLNVVSARQGDARIALINNAGGLGLLELLTDMRVKGSPRSVTVCGNHSGTLQEIYARSTTGRKLLGAEVVTAIGVWRYVATYVHPATEPSDPRAEQSILNVCKNPKSDRSSSSKLPEGHRPCPN